VSSLVAATTVIIQNLQCITKLATARNIAGTIARSMFDMLNSVCGNHIVT